MAKMELVISRPEGARPCYWCGDVVASDDIAVTRYGHGAPILLHRACAGSLGIALIGDSREIGLAAGEAPHLERFYAPFHWQKPRDV